MAPRDLVSRLRERFLGRAAGWWHIADDALVQVAFSSAPDMPEDVAHAFADATQRVPLSSRDLGIVRAALLGQTAVSRASELSAEHGSGLWLRKFGAARSIASPVRGRDGAVTEILSVAVGDAQNDESTVIVALEAIAAQWPDVH